MIAYHFPPQRGSSGIQRTLRFARYLPEFGWEPRVLTVHPRAYEAVDTSDDVPTDLAVHRAPAFDAARHFAVFNRYPSFIARPDRWASWWWGGVPTGLKIVRRFRPDALWSTYPIATAHAIGHTLARITRLPWIADFRDPMAQEGYPEEPAVWRAFLRIESRTVRHAERSVFTTPGAARRYQGRYPECADRISVIENGYDEEMFAGLAPKTRNPGKPFVLLHSGIVYPSERDPTALFTAVGMLRERGQLDRGELRIRFRAPVHDAFLEELATRFHVTDVVDILPALPYRDALREMFEVDGLMVLQAANCNEQIPAKLYEYMRAGRPILGLADPDGDTGQAMLQAGIAHVAALENARAVADVLERFIRDVQTGLAKVPDAVLVRHASRYQRTARLAALLDSVLRG